MLLRQETRSAFDFALLRAGNSIAARIAMMAITTSNSIRVNAIRDRPLQLIRARARGPNRGDCMQRSYKGTDRPASFFWDETPFYHWSTGFRYNKKAGLIR